MPSERLGDHAPRLQQWVEQFLDYLVVEKGLAANTYEAYATDLADFAEYLGSRSFGLEDVSQLVLEQYLIALAQEGASAATRKRRVAALRSFFAFLAREHGLANPASNLNSPRRPQQLPKAISRRAMEQVLEQPDSATVLGCRDTAILELLYATGARVSELTALDQNDIDMRSQFVRLTGKGDKQRLVPVGRPALDALQDYLSRSRPQLGSSYQPPLFLTYRGNRLSRQSVWKLVKDYGAQAGAPGLTPHVFRHSFATHLLAGGADLRIVAELLGHASVSTTQVYTQVTPQHLQDSYRQSHPRA